MDVTDKIKPLKYYSFQNLNKRVYFWGFTRDQLFIGAGSVIGGTLLSFIMINYIVALVILIAGGIPFIVIMKKVQKENKENEIDFIQAWKISMNSNKVIIDKDNILKKLIKNGESE